jgi:hypothetical protein
MGEARRRALAVRRGSGDEPAEPQVVDTLGGRMHVRWDEGAAATPHGQLVFFAEFLATTGVFDRWVSECSLEYRSGNAPDKRDVLGTLMLGFWLATGAARTSPRCTAMRWRRRPWAWPVSSARMRCAGRWSASTRRPVRPG